jgi:predicted membrane protein
MTEALAQGFVIGVVVVTVGVVVLGYRDRAQVDLSDQLAVLLAIFVGIALAMVWEVVQFIADWTMNSDFQPSNLDTMVELLWSDVFSVVGAVLSAWFYCRVLHASRRAACGDLGVWLFTGPSRLLDRHGFAMTLVFTVLVMVAVAALWFTGRPVPGFPIG